MIVLRAEAKQEGLPRYFTGIACTNGHISDRYTANKTCVECANQTANKTKSKNRQKYCDSSTAWGRKNPDSLLKYQRIQNKKNPGRRNMWTANYRSAKDVRAPEWMNDGHLFEIQCAYTYCSALRSAGLDYHVDHAVPLRGASVSGLHVPWNLQIIPGVENVTKGNKFNG